MMNKISTDKAPAAAGHYSQAISHNGLVFVAGQLPIDPVSREVVEGGIEPQVIQVIDNIKAILEAAGSGLDKILKATIYNLPGQSSHVETSIMEYCWRWR